MNVCVYTDIHIHTCLHTDLIACTCNAHFFRTAYTHTHVYIYIYIYIYTHPYIHKSIHTHRCNLVRLPHALLRSFGSVQHLNLSRNQISELPIRSLRHMHDLVVRYVYGWVSVCMYVCMYVCYVCMHMLAYV
jgi:hypothetical protein